MFSILGKLLSLKYLSLSIFSTLEVIFLDKPKSGLSIASKALIIANLIL
jgi:hypothetical protein